MKHYLILFSVVIFCFSSCNFSYSSKTQHKQKKKQIDGKEYRFSNFSEQKQFRIFLFRNTYFLNEVRFYGLKKPVITKITNKHFIQKINIIGTNKLKIDSVSFYLYPSKNKIDLQYYLNLDGKSKNATFTLYEQNNKWRLN